MPGMKNASNTISKIKVRFLQESILNWYSEHGREFPWRRTQDWKKGLLAEMLLRKTTSRQVMSLYEDLLREYPSFESLCNARIEELEAFIRPLGLHKIRARQLQTLSCCLQTRTTAPSILELRSFKGVGIYIANAIHCFYLNRRLAIVDTNFSRLYNRYFGWGLPRDATNSSDAYELAKRVLPEKRYIEYNYGVLDLAAQVCKSNQPLCDDCPLKEKCKYVKSFQ